MPFFTILARNDIFAMADNMGRHLSICQRDDAECATNQQLQEVAGLCLEDAVRVLQQLPKSHEKKGWNFYIGGFIDWEHLEFMRKDGSECIIRGTCYQSMKKNESPHQLKVVLSSCSATTQLVFRQCSCVAGKGICNHIVALLYTLAHFKTAGYKIVPPIVTCTSVSQQWHVPSRTNGIFPQPVKSLRVQSPLEKSAKLSARKRNLSDIAILGKKRKPVECVKPKIYNPIRQGLYETASSFSADLRANLFKFENQLQIFKVLPVSFSNQVKIDSAYGSVYKGSTLANQNQVVNSVNLIPNKEVLQCPPFQLPDITRKFATALSAAEIECFEGFAVSEELSVKY
eukprot:gene11155-20039_t